VPRGVRAAASVVIFEAGADVGGETDVRASRVSKTPQDIDDALGCHACLSASPALDQAAGTLENLGACGNSDALAARLSSTKGDGFCKGIGVSRPPSGSRFAGTESGLANRSSFGGGDRSAVAPSALWRTTSACDHERRLVAQIFTRWNRFERWFGLVDGLKKAA
jgi:hypothetical protein